VKQHAIDLLPEAFRSRMRQTARVARVATAATLAAALSAAAITHARVSLGNARAEYLGEQARSEEVLAIDARVAALQRSIAEVQAFAERYRLVAPVVEVGDVIATLVNRLPEGSTIDRIDIEHGALRTVRPARERETLAPGSRVPRRIQAELAGFAPSDRAVAEYVATLQATSPFRNVSLDYSRTREIRGRIAREFRLSLQIDLEQNFAQGERGEDR